MLKKKSCSKFFDKLKFFYFFRVILRTCLKNSSKGTRNNQEKIWIGFWEMLKIHILNQKNCWKKKVVRNFLTNLKFFIFLEFFSENVLKTLLGGQETTRKKYRIVFEKCWKYMIFFDFACPPITHPSPIHHPSIRQYTLARRLEQRGWSEDDYILENKILFP